MRRVTTARDRELRRLNQQYQRLTAYGCHLRGAEYDAAVCERARLAFWAAVG